MHVWLRNRNMYTWNNMLDCRKWDIRLTPPYRFALLVLDEAGGPCSRTGNISSPGLGKRRGMGSCYENQRMGTR